MLVGTIAILKSVIASASHSAYKKYVEDELAAAAEAGTPGVVVDPVLGKPLDPSLLKLSTPDGARKYIQVYNNVLPEKKKGADDDEDEENEGAQGQGESKSANAGDQSPGAGPAAGSKAPSSSSDAAKRQERRERRERKNRR